MALEIETERTVDRTASQEILQAQRERMLDAAQFGANVSREEAPFDRGNLQRAIYEPQVRGDRVVWGVSGVDYAAPQEFGTEPFLADLDALIEWGERKFGSAAAGVGAWRAIAKRGIKAKRYMQAGAEEQKRAYENSSLEEFL